MPSIKIIIDNNKIDSNLSHYPIPIFLGTSVGQTSYDATAVFDSIGASYKKIAVFKEDLSTELYVEVDKWDETEEKAVLWVSKPDFEIDSATQTILYLVWDSGRDDNPYVGKTDEESTALGSFFTGDNFVGTNGDLLNQEYWVPEETGRLFIYGNKSRADVGTSGTSDIVRGFLRYELSGDFDIQVDFDLISFPVATTYSFTGIQVRWSSGRCGVFRTASTADGQRYQAEDLTLPISNYTNSDTTGKFRIKRVGTSITCYIWSGTQWEWNGNTAGYTCSSTSEDIIFNTYCHAGANSVAITDLSNFTVTADNISVIPSKIVWDRYYKSVYHLLQDPNGDVVDSIIDSTTFGHSGTPAGSMTTSDLVDGLTGDAIDFDGVDDHIDLGVPSDLDIIDDITVEAIIKPSALTGFARVGSKSGGTTTDGQWNFRLNSDASRIQMAATNGTGTYAADSPSGINTTSFHYVSGTYKESTKTYTAFLAGVKGVPFIGTVAKSTTTEHTAIGCRRPSAPTSFFPGVIDEFRISDFIRSDAWIKATSYAVFDDLLSLEAGDNGDIIDFGNYPLQITSELEDELNTLLTLHLPNLEINSELDFPHLIRILSIPSLDIISEIGVPNIGLTLGLPGFEITSELTGTAQQRVKLEPLSATSELFIRDVFVCPENTTCVGAWPFETRSEIGIPLSVVIISLEPLKSQSILAIPLIEVDGEAKVTLPSLSMASSLKSDLSHILAVPPFILSSVLDLLAVKIMPEGDYYITMIPFEIESELNIPLIQTIIQLEALEIESTIQVGDVYAGFTLEVPPLEINSTISSIMFNTIELVPIQISSTLSAIIQLAVYSEAFEVTSSLEVASIYSGYFVELVPLIITSKLEAIVNNYLSIPAFEMLSILEIPDIQRLVSVSSLELDSVITVDNIIIFTTEFADIYYYFTLTGDFIYDDIEIPISSFQCNMRNNEPTYLQVVIPGIEHANDIANRSSGELLVFMAYKLNGVIVRKQIIVSATLETIRIDDGTDNQSITLTGHKTESFVQKDINITGETYKSISNGKIRYRIATPNMDIKPGDSVTIGTDTFQADLISYYFRATKNGIAQNMEIAEA